MKPNMQQRLSYFRRQLEKWEYAAADPFYSEEHRAVFRKEAEGARINVAHCEKAIAESKEG